MADLPYSIREALKPRVAIPGATGVVVGTALAAGASNFTKKQLAQVGGAAAGRFVGPIVGVIGGLAASWATYELTRMARGAQFKKAGSIAAGVTAFSALGFGAFELITGSNPIGGVGAAFRNLPSAIGFGGMMPSAIRFQTGAVAPGPLRTFQYGAVVPGPLGMGYRRKNLVVA